MNYNKFINNSYCVGGKHYSPTPNIHGEIRNNNVKMLRGTCMTCSRNKSLIVSDRTINGEGLGDFFKHLGKAAKSVGKKILNDPGRAYISLVHQGKGLCKAEGLSSNAGSKAGNASKGGKGLYLGKFH